MKYIKLQYRILCPKSGTLTPYSPCSHRAGCLLSTKEKKKSELASSLTTLGRYKVQRTSLIFGGTDIVEPTGALLETNIMRARFYFRPYSSSLKNKRNVGVLIPLRCTKICKSLQELKGENCDNPSRPQHFGIDISQHCI